MEYFSDPFRLGLLLGLGIGFVFALFISVNGWIKRRVMVKDNRILREHLHTQMTISAQGNQASLKEAEQLKAQNENLRVSLAVLKNQPDKSELRMLYLYDKAIHLMYEKAPGFASAWESIMKDAEVEMEKTSTGVVAWIRRVIRPSLAAGTSRSSLPASSSEPAVRVVENSGRP